MYGTTSTDDLLLGESTSIESIRQTVMYMDNVIEYPVMLWATLVRFYRKTRVLECIVVAASVVYGYALVFGMYINGWSFTQSTYFFSYTVATIGYTYSGKMTPMVQALLSLYILTSVLVCSLLLGLFVAAITDASEASIESQLRQERQEHALPSQRLLQRKHETRVEARARIELQVAYRTTWVTFLQMVAVSIVGIAAIIVLDRGISVCASVLLILETITTVGYGTTKLDTPIAAWFTIIFIIPGCLSWARFVAAVSRYPLALRRYHEVIEKIKALRCSERTGLSVSASKEMLEGHRRLADLVKSNDQIPTSLSDLKRPDFVIQWLLATHQASIHDVLDAHDIYTEFSSSG